VCVLCIGTARYLCPCLSCLPCHGYGSILCSCSALSPSDCHTAIIYALVTSVPNNICPTIWSLPLSAAAIAITTYNTRPTSHHLGSTSHDPINPHHNRPTIPNNRHHHHTNNHEEIPSHPLNNRPRLSQPPKLLHLQLKLNPAVTVALRPPLLKHRRPQHPLTSRFSRSFATPLPNKSKRQPAQHAHSRIAHFCDGAQA
jgi:hypothetical protein